MDFTVRQVGYILAWQVKFFRAQSENYQSSVRDPILLSFDFNIFLIMIIMINRESHWENVFQASKND